MDDLIEAPQPVVEHLVAAERAAILDVAGVTSAPHDVDSSRED